jgi:deoxyribodipyrimidine photo-lyase
VRPCVGTPESIITPLITDAGQLPVLADLGLDEPVDDLRSTDHFAGGETAALVQLQQFFLNNQQAGKAKNQRTAAFNNNSSKLSPWIALGCVSLREVYWEVIKQQHSNSQTYNALLLDLLWRDYFRFMFKKHGQKFIAAKNNEDETQPFAANQDELFESWKYGETGTPLVDAFMHELNATGYLNNYGRQVVAGFLVNDLKVDWTKGAAYFEEKLIDYSPASNWGNWAFIAGINDARESRYAIASKPTLQLETKSDFIDTWLPHAAIGNYPAFSNGIALK